MRRPSLTHSLARVRTRRTATRIASDCTGGVYEDADDEGAGGAGVDAARPDAGATASLRPPTPPGAPEGRAIELPGRGTTFVREAGGPAGAPTLLLLHGWTATGGI